MDKTTQERIKADAQRYTKDEGYQKVYIAGATAENYFATPLYDALLELFALKELKDKHGKTPEYLKRQPVAWQKVKEALNKWKGKEVKPPKCVASNCGMCGKLGNNQYLGNQFYLCDECFEDYEKGIDQPTPY